MLMALCAVALAFIQASSKTESIYTGHADLQRLCNSGILDFRQGMEIVGTALLSELTVEMLNRVPAKPLPTSRLILRKSVVSLPIRL